MGIDDVMAISMLEGINNIEIEKIATVSGVSNVNKGLDNLLKLLNYLNSDIPVYRGSACTINKSSFNFPSKYRVRAENLSGFLNLKLKRGVNNIVLKCPYRKINQTEILSLGPLTNIAIAIAKYKASFTQKVKKLSIMGGGIGFGNVPPLNLAEYNVWLDPKAANIVFNSGIPITLVTLDATSSFPLTKKYKTKVTSTKPKGKNSEILKNIILKSTPQRDSFCDLIAALCTVNNKLITESKIGNVKVILRGKNRGQTIFNQNPRGTVQLVSKIDTNQIEKTLLNFINN